MPISTDIIEAYIRPRAVMARKLSGGQREDRALAYLIGACVLIFVAQWPLLARQAHFDPSVSLNARIAGALLGWIIIAPLVFYGIAAILHIFTRVFKGVGTWFTTRLSLFWTLLAITPLMLLQGLTAGFIGPSPALTLVSAVVLGAFFWIWINGMIASERAPKDV